MAPFSSLDFSRFSCSSRTLARRAATSPSASAVSPALPIENLTSCSVDSILGVCFLSVASNCGAIGVAEDCVDAGTVAESELDDLATRSPRHSFA